MKLNALFIFRSRILSSFMLDFIDVIGIDDKISHVAVFLDVSFDFDPLADFDGIKPDTEIENAGDMPRLRKAFLDAGLSEADTDKIMYKNANRVLHDLLA